MPRHQQVTTCRRSGGPISRHCTCEACNLAMCAVCGAYEGGLTTDCPGTRISFDKQREVHETCLDYTDDRGWHQGAPMEHRSPRFTSTRLPPAAPRMDPRAIVAPTVDWAKIDQNKALQHDLTLRAIAWTLADRQCDDLSAALVRAKDDADALGSTEPDVQITKLERARASFQRACRRYEECDDEFRQTARRLVSALEDGHLQGHGTPVDPGAADPGAEAPREPDPGSDPGAADPRDPDPGADPGAADPRAADTFRTSSGEVVQLRDLALAASLNNPNIDEDEHVLLARAALAGDQTALDEFHGRTGLVLPVTEYRHKNAVRLHTVDEWILNEETTSAHAEARVVFLAGNSKFHDEAAIDATELVAWVLSPGGRAALARRGLSVTLPQREL